MCSVNNLEEDEEEMEFAMSCFKFLNFKTISYL